MKITKLKYLQNLIYPYKSEKIKLEEYLDYILNNKLYLFPLDNIKITNNNKFQPHYNFSNKTINIPLNYEVKFNLISITF